MRILLVALGLLFGGTAAWAQNTVADRAPFELHLSAAWQHTNQPGLGLFQRLDLDGKFAIGGGITRYWPVGENSDLGIGLRAQYLPGTIGAVLNNPPFVGGVNVNGSYRVWALVAFVAWRYYLHERFRFDANAGVGAGFTSLQMTNLAGVTVGSGSSVVPTWMLRAALLYKLSETIWVGPYLAYFVVNKWNATVPAATIGPREALLIGAVVTIGMKLF
jgi:hypothetical protein